MLEQVADPEWRSRLRRAAQRAGIEEPVAGSMTITSPPAGPVDLPYPGERNQGGLTFGLAAMKQAGDPHATIPTSPTGQPSDLPAACHEPEDASGQTTTCSGTMGVSGGENAGPQTTVPPGEAGNGPAEQPAEGTSPWPMRYRVLRPHAEGGLGAVFVAHDEELHREVALKEILERHVHDRENRLRFLLEAEVTGGLEHPGIVPVYGLGHYEDGRPYYAMRFIRGKSLKRPLPSSTWQTTRLAIPASELCRCVACSTLSWTFARRSPMPTAVACSTAISSRPM